MRPHSLRQPRGSVLISAAIAAAVLSILVGGFLAYLSNEYNLNYRSHCWNQSLHLAEAAVEIGFAEMNYQKYQGNIGFQASRGWVAGTNSGTYTLTTNSFTGVDGKVIGNLNVTVTGATAINPVITGVGTCTVTPTSPNVVRAVQVQLMASSRFPVALMSKNKLDMNGNGIYTDSFDSTDLNKSTGARYDATKKQFNGNIASDGTIINSLNIGNADIYGVAYTGVGGTVALGAQGSIGPTFDTASRATTVSQALGQGWIESDFNVDVADVLLPTGAASWSHVPGTTGGGNGAIIKDCTLNSGDYIVDSITLNSSAHGDVLLITGNVRIYVTGNVDISGLASLVVDTNASLKVYIGGNSVQIAGNGVVNNSAAPINNQWYGLPTSTSWSVTGNGNWTGTMYAPEATISFKGGGTNGDASGAVVANIITLTGHARFHYDEALRASDTGAGYAIASWRELRYVSGAWVP